MSHPPAGWYPDPGGAPGRRYWDGSAWTEHTEPAPPPQTPMSPAPGYAPAASAPAEGSPNTALIVCGYVFAFLIPIVGFVLGIIAATRPARATSKHGVWIIVASVAAFVFWLAMFGAGNAT